MSIIKVNATIEDKFKVTAQAGNHTYVMDKSAEAGGDDTGARPGAVLAVALSGCTAMVVKGYLDHKGYDYDDIQVEVTRDTNDNTRVNDYDVTVNIDGDLSPEIIEKVQQHVSKHCTVGNIIQNPATINTVIECN